MNQTGLAQKYGSVVSHKIARDQSDIHAVRVKDAQANLLLEFDALVASNPDSLRKLSHLCHHTDSEYPDHGNPRFSVHRGSQRLLRKKPSINSADFRRTPDRCLRCIQATIALRATVPPICSWWDSPAKEACYLFHPRRLSVPLRSTASQLN